MKVMQNGQNANSAGKIKITHQVNIENRNIAMLRLQNNCCCLQRQTLPSGARVTPDTYTCQLFSDAVSDSHPTLCLLLIQAGLFMFSYFSRVGHYSNT